VGPPDTLAGITADAPPAGDVELRGTVPALGALAEAIERTGRFRLEQSSSALLEELAVTADDDAVEVAVDGATLQIRGRADALGMLAGSVRFVARGPSRPQTVAYHLHIDPTSGLEWLSRNSAPLIVTLEEQ
jgi:hypothetical protein